MNARRFVLGALAIALAVLAVALARGAAPVAPARALRAREPARPHHAAPVTLRWLREEHTPDRTTLALEVVRREWTDLPLRVEVDVPAGGALTGAPAFAIAPRDPPHAIGRRLSVKRASTSRW